MDSVITAAARALSLGDPLAALKQVALRDDAPALALRGIAMAQLGDLARARDLLRSATRAFGQKEALARARCIVAEAEIALALRDLGSVMKTLRPARETLDSLGDSVNAAHAGYLDARRLLLIGHLDEAERILDDIDTASLPQASRAGHALVAAGIAMRRVRTEPARAALARASEAARDAGHAALTAEVERASRAFDAPAATLVTRGSKHLLGLGEVETLLASDKLIVDACRNVVRAGTTVVPLASRPVLFALVRALAEAWPEDVSREMLLERIFGARHADESHRTRLRVEIARLRKALEPQAALKATRRGFVLEMQGPGEVVVLTPPVEGDHAEVMALLADGEAWSSSALALALGVSSRTTLRALEALSEAGKVESFGRGRACRWIQRTVPGFPTSLLLPAPLPNG